MWDCEEDKIPPAWMKEFAKEKVKDLLIDGKIEEFYGYWGQELKNQVPLIELFKILASTHQIYGKMENVLEPLEPTTIQFFTYAWEVIVPLIQNSIEFQVNLWISINKVILSFRYYRVLAYHPPDYLRNNYTAEITNEIPKFLFTKPQKSDFPIALFVPSNPDLDIDGRLGFCHPHKDLEFLSTAGIGLIRGEFTDQMKETAQIFEQYCAIGVQPIVAASKSFFLILHSLSTLSFPRIWRKFEGMIKGVVLINPLYESPEGSPFTTLDLSVFPQCNMLMIFGKLSIIFEKNYKEFSKVAKTIKAEVEVYDFCDDFLFEGYHNTQALSYGVNEFHLSDVPLRKIASWIRSQ